MSAQGTGGGPHDLRADDRGARSAAPADGPAPAQGDDDRDVLPIGGSAPAPQAPVDSPTPTVMLDGPQIDAISSKNRPSIGPRVRVNRTGATTRIDDNVPTRLQPGANTAAGHAQVERSTALPEAERAPPAAAEAWDPVVAAPTLAGVGDTPVEAAVVAGDMRNGALAAGQDATLAGARSPLPVSDGPSGGWHTVAEDPQTEITLSEGDHPETSLDAKIRRQLEEDHRPREDEFIGQTIGGRFEVLSKLGAGGMGAVYRARQQGMDRDVAIKVLLEEMARSETVTRRFTIEALAVSRLKHPNTIQIFDFGKTDNGNLYIAMELLEGSTLHDLLKGSPRLPIRRALRIIAGVAGSLSEAHGKEIIHRDLKPENIFLTRVGKDEDFVKVLDFGVAKLRDGAGDGKGTLTKAGSIFGTPRYMSPEQASARPVDARSDLYSLGVILYEMVSGRPPFIEETPLHLLLAHAHKTPPPLCEACPDLALPREVDALITRLLEKLPQSRVQTAAELAAECLRLAHTLPAAFDTVVPLEEAVALRVELATSATVDVSGSGLDAATMPTHRGAPPPGPAPTTSRPHRRRWPLVLALSVGVSAVAVGLVLVQAERRSSPPARPEVAASAPPTPRAALPVVEAPVEVDAGPAVMRVSVVTRPAGAQVVVVGPQGEREPLGPTPLEVRRTKGTRLKIRLELDGHQPEERPLHFMYNETLDLALAPLAPIEKKPAAPVKRRPAETKAADHSPQAPTVAPTVKTPVKPKRPGGLVDDLL